LAEEVNHIDHRLKSSEINDLRDMRRSGRLGNGHISLDQDEVYLDAPLRFKHGSSKGQSFDLGKSNQ